MASLRILLVDDDEIFCRSLARALRGQEIGVHWVLNGDQATILVESSDFDVVLLDLHLGASCGIALLKHWRERAVMLPVVMLTGDNATKAKLEAFELGADDFISKPFELQELVARILAQHRRASEYGLSMTMGGGSLDLVRGCLSADGHEIELTRAEQRLLVALAQAHGAPVTRKMLGQALWDDSSAKSRTCIDNHLARLRGKIGSLGMSIECVDETGYRLRAPPRAE